MAWQEQTVSVSSIPSLTFNPSREDAVLSNKVFCVTTNDITSGAVGGTETPQVLISNPINNTKKMKIYNMIFQTNVSTNNNIFRVYLNPTVLTNGTSLVPVCLHLDGNNTLSSMQIFKVPTVSSNGSQFLNIISGPTSSVPLFFYNTLILESGQKLLIGVRPNTTGVTYSVDIFWVEE